MYGLSENTINMLKAVFSGHPAVKEVILYGSRAKGNYRNGSDIDLTLIGDRIDTKSLYKVQNDIDALNLPYKVDLSIYDQIDNPELIDHIKRVGKQFYNRTDLP